MVGSDARPARTGPGRQRDPRIDRAVRSATLKLLDEVGYADLSIGEVARRAGVHRPAVYRRWPSKRHLVVDTIASTMGLAPTPDTGDLRHDLRTGITTLVDAFTGTPLGKVLPALAADLAHDPELRRSFLDEVFHTRRNTTEQALRSAMARGQIRDGIDIEFVLDVLAAPFFYRAVFGHAPLTPTLVDQVVDMVLTEITAQ